MRYAVGIPNVGDYGDPRLLVELARDAEAAGWDAVLLWDHVAYRRRGWPVADPLPRPAQLPRPPLWIAGRWPNRPPFRRAARWDGVVPTHAAVDHAGTMTPAQLGEIVRYTLAHRPAGLGPFEVVVEGHTAGPDRAADHQRVGALEAAGLTWWVEKLGWFHGPVATARRRVRAGPPRP